MYFQLAAKQLFYISAVFLVWQNLFKNISEINFSYNTLIIKSMWLYNWGDCWILCTLSLIKKGLNLLSTSLWRILVHVLKWHNDKSIWIKCFRVKIFLKVFNLKISYYICQIQDLHSNKRCKKKKIIIYIEFGLTTWK